LRESDGPFRRICRLQEALEEETRGTAAHT
jgi:hypothetical protein